jgi:zinc transporter
VPTISRFGREDSKDDLVAHRVTWIDVDIADAQDLAWLTAWKEISDQTRTSLLEPVRFSHREHLADGMLLSLRTMRAGETDDLDRLTDLKLLIAKSRVITVRTGEVAAVDELREFLRSGRSLVTAVDLLGFMISGMTKRMEAVIFDLTMDIDAIEDRLLDSGSVPLAQSLGDLRRRIFRIRRQLNSVQQVLLPIATDPALILDAEDRETLVRASNHVTRYMESLEDCRTRVQMLQDHIEAQRAATITRSSLNLTIVATVFLPLTFVSGLLGMNVAGIPAEHNPLSVWVVTIALVVLALLAWLVLRWRMRD